jgi:hypothetical protein
MCQPVFFTAARSTLVASLWCSALAADRSFARVFLRVPSQCSPWPSRLLPLLGFGPCPGLPWRPVQLVPSSSSIPFCTRSVPPVPWLQVRRDPLPCRSSLKLVVPLLFTAVALPARISFLFAGRPLLLAPARRPCPSARPPSILLGRSQAPSPSGGFSLPSTILAARALVRARPYRAPSASLPCPCLPVVARSRPARPLLCPRCCARARQCPQLARSEFSCARRFPQLGFRQPPFSSPCAGRRRGVLVWSARR